MARTIVAALTIPCLILAAVPQTNACSWSPGYFYQVTALKGRVVGSNVVLFQFSRWFRQTFARADAKMSLYEYRGFLPVDGAPVVKTVKTGDYGDFDFGDVRAGHYTVVIEDKAWNSRDYFDVEIRELRQSTKSITIDLSPNLPDCTGGHEFIVKSN